MRVVVIAFVSSIISPLPVHTRACTIDSITRDLSAGGIIHYIARIGGGEQGHTRTAACLVWALAVEPCIAPYIGQQRIDGMSKGKQYRCAR